MKAREEVGGERERESEGGRKGRRERAGKKRTRREGEYDIGVKRPCTCTLYMYVHTLNQSLRQGKAKQLCPKTTPFFSREKNELPQAGFNPPMFCVLGRRSTN